MFTFNGRCAIGLLIKDLKQYRPKLKPLTNISSELAKNRVVKRKRRLIVRDWLFFAVWYCRLKRLVKEV